MITAGLASLLARLVLAVHLAVVLFNVLGFVAIPLGAWFRLRFVRIFWWRALHLASLSLVAVQAAFGRACFLTLWQTALTRAGGQTGVDQPLLQYWVNRLLYWPLPLSVFTMIYAAVWVAALALWWWVPPRRTGRP